MYKKNILKNDSIILNIIMDTLYDGIIAINKEGFITMISKGYAMIFKKKREDIIGKHITEMVEETRLPRVVKTGQAEIAELLKINSQYLIVSRIPIVKDGEVIGAIAKIIFKSIKDLNDKHEHINRMKKQLNGLTNNISALNRTTYSFEDIVGEGVLIKSAKRFAEKAAWSSSNVLLLGESGTGKELFAHAIHKESRRRNGAFIKVNCGAIPGELLESELFGYEGGSFTGAKKEGKIGKFELADGGTIFLDEIIAPATTSLWPPIYLVQEWTTTSIPISKGFWNKGVAQVLSIIVVIPFSLESFAISGRSSILKVIVPGLSKYKTFVLGLIAFSMLSMPPWSKTSWSIPYFFI